jgi:hypothetical protein
MAVDIRVTRIVNIYASSGTAKRQERETFYNSDFPGILHAVDILGGDFNCVLDKNDVTGQGTYSRSLATLIKGYSKMRGNLALGAKFTPTTPDMVVLD